MNIKNHSGDWVLELCESEVSLVNCKVCKTSIPLSETFFVCKETKSFFCYDCKGKEWDIRCSLSDEHEHHCIRNCEVKK